MAPMIATANTLCWDSTLVLHINPRNHIFTCVGKTKANLPCKNSIRQSDRDDAIQILGLLCQQSPEQVTVQDLAPVANCLLCTRWHRGRQAQAKALEWYSLLKQSTIKPPQGKQQDQPQDIRTLMKRLNSEKQKREAENVANAEEIEQLKGKLRMSQVEKLSYKQKTLELDLEINTLNHRLSEERQTSCNLQDELSRSRRLVEEKDRQLRLVREELSLDSVALAENNFKIDALKGKNETLNQSLKEQDVKHEETVEELHTQLQTKDEALLDISRQQHEIESTLKQHKLHAAAEATELKTQNRRLRVKLYFNTFRTQMQVFIKQRKYDEVLADKQALLDQQKILQQEMSHLDEVRKSWSSPSLSDQHKTQGLTDITAFLLTFEPAGSQERPLHCCCCPAMEIESEEAFRYGLPRYCIHGGCEFWRLNRFCARLRHAFSNTTRYIHTMKISQSILVSNSPRDPTNLATQAR